MFTPLTVRADDAAPSEYQVKAAYLINFAKYVEWPTNTAPRINESFVIGLVGRDDFGEDLKKVIETKTVNGRGFVFQRLDANPPAEQSCHILFVSNSEKRRLPELLAKYKGQSVLLVGETDNFLAAGGMINFTMKDKTVRFAIKPVAAERAGLKVSSKLIMVAEEVNKE